MKGRFRTLAAGAATAVAVASVGVLAGGGTAFAAGGGGPTPPWESTAQANIAGSITFYNAQGQVVTGGSITANGLAAYAVASSPGPAGYTKATLHLYTPSLANPGTWSNNIISASTTYPNTAAPAPIGTTANPVESNTGSDATISSLVAAIPNTVTQAGYPGLYDVRMTLSGAGQPALTTYYDTVISVDTTNNTWSVDFPDFTQNTTTTLSASPPSPQTAPASPVTLTATVSPASAGTVSFWSGSTQVGTTQTVTATNGVATVSVTPPTGSTPYQAIYTPAVGSADIGSASSTLNYQVTVPLDATTTTLAQTGGGAAAGLVTFTGNVSDTTNTATTVNAGTVSLFDNGSTTPFASGAVSSTGSFSIPFTYTSAGGHSVVATYSGNATQFAGSSSAPVTFTETAPACTTCNDTQTIEGTVPAGTISISTPYTATNPLNLGTLALNSAGTFFTASAPLDNGTGVVGSTFQGITIVDTQAGALPWTVTATSSNLSDGSGHANGVINGENVGLTGLTPVFVTGNSIVAGDVNVFNQPAATPPVSPTDPGTLGLKSGPTIATDTIQPVGTVGINGTVTLNAPTSTEAGTFVGTITFTITG